MSLSLPLTFIHSFILIVLSLTSLIQLDHRKSGRRWTIGVVHFVPSKHLGGEAAALWRRQRDKTIAWMKSAGTNVVVMGDFNGQWSDNIAMPFHDVARVQDAPSHGKRKIDWVLRKIGMRGDGGGVALDHQGQSDHKPVKGVVIENV